ncbi:hypothetical protein CISG_00595 [Coccidioides immitis RMSCC 3703]|uniref:Uncharacterized protein n=1 Tax=Coccidioides immitis RMSCC 3703 TaxID=454286 RepID=A0A0J8QRF0_COCIT|nr:hypothetical protein CISG_00595 [Coccidioides immitis RMSCC 3703]
MVHPEPDRIQTGIANDAPVNRLLLPSTSLLDTQFTRTPLGFRFVRVYPFPFSVPLLPSLLEGFRSRSDKSLFLLTSRRGSPNFWYRGGPDEFPADVDKEFTKSE